MTVTQLLSADPSGNGSVRLRGYVDQANPRAGIRGWAADLSAPPDAAVVVEVCAGDVVVASAPANLLREDIQRRGHGRFNVGFRFGPAELRTGLSARGVAADAPLRLRIAGTEFAFRSGEPLPPAGGFLAPADATVVALAGDLDVGLRNITARAAVAIASGLPPKPGPAAGFIECLSWERDGLAWVMGWMQPGLALHGPAIISVGGAAHPSAFVVATHGRTDLPDGALGIVGLLGTDWRPDGGEGPVQLVFLGDAADAHLRLVKEPKLLTAGGLAGWIGKRDGALGGPFADALLRRGLDRGADVAPLPPISEAPPDFDGLMKRGTALAAAGDPDAALALFEAALALKPGNPWARMASAGALRGLGRGDEADAICRAVLADAPENTGALMSLGHSLRQRGDSAGALPLFQAALALQPREAWARMAVADTLADLKRDGEAEELCRAVLADEPENAGALMSLGHLLRRRGDSAGALPLFQAALALRPREAWARMAVADTLAGLHRLDEAEDLCRAVLADAPEHVGALMSLGHIGNARADRAAAAAWFERAARAAPGSAGAGLAFASALRDLGDFDAARQAAEAVLARDPDDAEGWMSLGHTERRAGRRDAALGAFTRAAERKPGAPAPLVQMAVEERRLGRPEACERLLARAIEADPDDPEALLQFGEHLRFANRLDEALAAFRRAIASPRPTLWAHLGASQVLVDTGGMDEALLTLADGEARLGAKPEFAAKRSELLRRTGDWPGALAVVEEAERTWPRHFGIWFERASLERLRGGPGGLEGRAGAPPVGNTFERARVHLLLGLEAADRWRFDEAEEHYARSIALNEDDGWPRICLAQTRLLALDIEGAREQLRAVSRLDFSAAKLQGRSTNISQTHLGQLLDEFILDRQALDGLRALRGLAPEARVAPLLALVERFPDYTPAAIALLTALRQSGRLGRRPVVGTGGAAAAAQVRIPRTFVQYWDDASPPPDLARVMGSWGKLYPGFALRRFTDEQARAFLARHHGAEVQAAYRRSRQPAQKADIFRLAYLHSQGGYYADADDRLVGDLEGLRFPGADLVLYQEDIGTIGNNFIGAVPGHPVIGRALRLAAEAINRGDSDILWLSTGPGMLTRAFASLVADPGRAPLAALDDAVVLEHAELQRTVSLHCLVGYKNTERHWSRTAFGRRSPAASPLPSPGSLTTAKGDRSDGYEAAAGATPRASGLASHSLRSKDSGYDGGEVHPRSTAV